MDVLWKQHRGNQRQSIKDLINLASWNLEATGNTSRSPDCQTATKPAMLKTDNWSTNSTKNSQLIGHMMLKQLSSNARYKQSQSKILSRAQKLQSQGKNIKTQQETHPDHWIARLQQNLLKTDDWSTNSTKNSQLHSWCWNRLLCSINLSVSDTEQPDAANSNNAKIPTNSFVFKILLQFFKLNT